MSIWRIPVMLTGASPDNPFVNVFHVQSDDSSAPLPMIQDALTALRAFYVKLTVNTTNVGNVLADGLTISAGTVTNVATQEQSTLSFPNIAPTTGAGRVPERLALVIGWKSTIAARRARGRTFVGPLSGFAVASDALPKQGIVDVVQTSAGQLLDASLGAGHAHFVTYGLVAKGGGPADPHTGYVRNAAVVKRHFATLRTRG